MFERMKLGAGRATALAAANAVIKRIAEHGFFISECEITEYSLKAGALAGNKCYPIIGRSNRGKRFNASVVIVPKKDPGEGFPIEKAIVAIFNPWKGGDSKTDYFECTFPDGETSIIVLKLQKSPHEIVEESKQVDLQEKENLLL